MWVHFAWGTIGPRDSSPGIPWGPRDPRGPTSLGTPMWPCGTLKAFHVSIFHKPFFVHKTLLGSSNQQTDHLGLLLLSKVSQRCAELLCTSILWGFYIHVTQHSNSDVRISMIYQDEKFEYASRCICIQSCIFHSKIEKLPRAQSFVVGSKP